MQNTPQLSRKLSEEIAIFFAYVPPVRLGRNLRDMLLEYLYLVRCNSNVNTEDLIPDVQLLLSLLDIVADEMDADLVTHYSYSPL